MSDTHTAPVLISVPGISCGHCKRAIEGALAGVAGVAGAEVDVESRTVALAADDDAALAAAVAAIEDAGYDVPDAPGTGR